MFTRASTITRETVFIEAGIGPPSLGNSKAPNKLTILYNYRLSKTEGCFARSYRISEAKLFTEFRHSIDYKEKNPNVIVNKLTGVE